MITFMKIESDPHSLGWYVTFRQRNQAPERIKVNWLEGEIIQAALRCGRNEARSAIKEVLQLEKEA